MGCGLTDGGDRCHAGADALKYGIPLWRLAEVVFTGLRSVLPKFAPAARGADLPAIAVLKSWLGDDGRLTSKLPELGYAGLVVEGMGGGHVHPQMAEQLEWLCRTMPVVVSTRVVGSHVLENTYGFVGSEIDLQRRGVLRGGWLTTGKLHLLMTAMLQAGSSGHELRQVLRGFGGG